jgi:Uncharacterized distant relative of cell wall-associated hydrolases
MRKALSFKRFQILVVICLVLAMGTNAAADTSYGGDGNTLNLSSLQVGDIIMLHGVIFSVPLPSGYIWEHCAIYIGNGEIVEAWSPAVRILPVSIINTASDAAIYRVKTTAAIKQAAVNFAIAQVGKSYDFQWLIPPGGKEIDGSTWYCSELIWAAYKKQGVELDKYPDYNSKYYYNVAPDELTMTTNVTAVAYPRKQTSRR